MTLAWVAAREVTTGMKHPYLQRDEEGNPVALVPPRKMTDEQVARARELLADPKQTITSVAKAVGVARSVLYTEVPEANGRYARLRAAAQHDSASAP
ncbi:helix-turn-helix domain-containing protein [Streptomyces uncialis]|uniref:helix-turn-helix domain-containing protein n=1 Tax=Streptomyces uncialis TaxID=1048205 RepID=UPI0037B72231